jgi:hypothetical protein
MGNRKRGLRHKRSKLNKRKNLIWQNYQRVKKVYSPALRHSVYFSKLGWNHLVERKKRTTPEYFRRLEVLPYAKDIVKTSTTYQARHINPKDGIEYINFVAVKSGITIKVTVTRIKSGKFTFFSIRRLV